MKKKALIALLSMAMLAVAAPSMAHRYQRNTNDNPFRLIGYIVHPVGLALEYAVMRPIHWAVSQHDTDVIFGHEAHEAERGKYFEWSHGNYVPSIAEEVKPMDASDADQARLANQAASQANAAAAPAGIDLGTTMSAADEREREKAEREARKAAEKIARRAEKEAREAAEKAVKEAEAAEKAAAAPGS